MFCEILYHFKLCLNRINVYEYVIIYGRDIEYVWKIRPNSKRTMKFETSLEIIYELRLQHFHGKLNAIFCHRASSLDQQLAGTIQTY